MRGIYQTAREERWAAGGVERLRESHTDTDCVGSHVAREIVRVVKKISAWSEAWSLLPLSHDAAHGIVAVDCGRGRTAGSALKLVISVNEPADGIGHASDPGWRDIIGIIQGGSSIGVGLCREAVRDIPRRRGSDGGGAGSGRSRRLSAGQGAA